ncbi:MAG: excinuclease ABC subunit UvrB [Candidatus Chisholmbacteria bacterium]|nr:excinuclease ABC subunit UvrB [Candidatus Chisholmbacteria bacterium]
MKFKLASSFSPTGDQPQAITKLTQGINQGNPHQVLLGVTGSGKTFTIANVIQNVQKPTLVISHNKTLAAQLYQEFRDFFPQNAVSYFVSYYDYYQPEAYIPQTDTYIEKETDINQEIDKLRLAATTNLLTREDVIIVASVSCIYNLGSPVEYGQSVLEIIPRQTIDRQTILRRLIDLQYDRSDYDLHRASFRLKGDTLELWPAYTDHALRIEFLDNTIETITPINPLTSHRLADQPINQPTVIYPAKHYLTDPKTRHSAFRQIRHDLTLRLRELKTQDKQLAAHRLNQRVNYDLEMIQEVGYVNGIENYSRYFDGRHPGQPPFTLLDYFHHNSHKFFGSNNFLTIIDESHQTLPQIRGMYRGDQARKQTLIDFGFRLPSALDNRPLRFEEFLTRTPQIIHTSATPTDWEINQAKGVVEQLIRPTNLLDPPITVHPTANQIPHLISQINSRVAKHQRVLVTTMTKRLAEAIAEYLKNHHLKVHYLHSDINTLDRSDILDSLRQGDYDVIVGINLLREGLDLPEVSLVAILDADKEGFLRSTTSLIQIMGRAARHVDGQVIMYADTTTDSMAAAIDEVNRRRHIQLTYNQTHGLTPQTVSKPIRTKLIIRQPKSGPTPLPNVIQLSQTKTIDLNHVNPDSLTPQDKIRLRRGLTRQMTLAAKNLDFELAAKIRDTIHQLQKDHP